MNDWTIPPLRVPRTELRIGVVGAGGIVRDAHLPGYRNGGLRVTAIADVRKDAAQTLADEHEIPHVFDDACALVRCDEVDVVDLAVPESARRPVLEAALAARKPVLAQKPLAYDLDTAREWVERFEQAGVPLAVNQNARWAPEFRGARALIDDGLLGQVFDLRWTMRYTADLRPWARDSWYAQDERFQVLSWSIHHLDLFRFLLGTEAESVFCALPRVPGQNFRGDILASAVLRFPGDVQATMVDSNAVTPGRPETQELDVDGTAGSLSLRVSEPRAFEYFLRAEMAGDGENAPAHRPALEGEWYPDGFLGSMGDLLTALEEGREPRVSGRDHLHTLALVQACYDSAARGQAVAPRSV